MADQGKKNRRDFLGEILRAVGLFSVSGLLGGLAVREAHGDEVWQIDPGKCTQCGKCATACVLTPSAVKCVHDYPLCGYCKLCFGYYEDQRAGDTEGAEDRRCPVNAIQRGLVEEPYYEYLINEPLCIGCAKCVEGCLAFGNGSLQLQVRHDRCANCNQCAIALACPSQAFVRVPAEQPYLLRSRKKQ